MEEEYVNGSHLVNSQLIQDLKRKVLKCLEMDRALNASQTNTFCPTTFDGYLCWLRSAPGTRSFQNCPDTVLGFDPLRRAYKDCLENGTWFTHPDTGLEWSNYSNCVDMEDLRFRNIVNNIYFTGYCISLVTLAISLSIFLSHRLLHCTRIWIHVHLFLSILLSNLLWILWYLLVVPDPLVIRGNPAWCIWLHLGINLTTVSAHLWMFCEGAHLYLVLVVVFLKEKVTIRCFLFIGWALPVILIILYGSVRYFQRPDNENCWIDDSVTMWFLTLPVCLALLVSAVFLVCVVRVLLKKLNPSSNQTPPLVLRKATRATIILIPLFGLQHLLIPFRPNTGTFAEVIYQIVSSVLLSSQGICVSCLFCFLNQEVHQALKGTFRKFYHQNIFNRESITILETMQVMPNVQSDVNN
ncbi:calcitonin gene-related peptide type 1 receptor-like [Ctenocephalides felis]|uniref:calcitonin gene-related peptide type 1 receptor-like n=1 Tax=Ctenocephalides felis TaxID=7515 RepID=UPI000E6E486B|nr:calcitonin gene-related peptide type 1 receptor-like [Ctenocephalides felis]